MNYTDIDLGTFHNLPVLKKINLNNNKIQVLQSNKYYGLSNFINIIFIKI